MTIHWQNSFTLDEAVGRAAMSALFHPMDYAKILIQLGHEPLPPVMARTIFFRRRLAYPGVFSYMRHIQSQDGYTGLFRGLGYKICYSLVNGFVHVNTMHMLKDLESQRDGQIVKDKEARSPGRGFTWETVKKLMEDMMRDTTCKVITLTISYPFQVLITRCCAQFVGGETTYDGFSSAIMDIYTREGICGFYAGFAPRLFGECLIIWVSDSVVFITEGILEEKNQQFKGYIQATINFLVQSLMYPFQLVSTVMSVNSSYLEASLMEPQYVNWVDCWKNLRSLGQLKRGASLFWRYQQQVAIKPLLVSKFD